VPQDRVKPILKVLEHLPVSAVISSPITGRIQWTNRHNVELSGASSREDLIGRSIFDFIESSQHAIALRDTALIAAGQVPPPVIYDLRKLDGGSAQAHISSVPMSFHGRPAMLSLVTEVTEREQLVRQLSESEERYRSLVETSPSGIVVVADDEIVFANPALVRALGMESDEALVGTSMYEHIVPEHRKAVREARRRVLMKKQPHPAAPVTLLRPDGSRVDALAATALVHWKGSPATQTILSSLFSR